MKKRDKILVSIGLIIVFMLFNQPTSSIQSPLSIYPLSASPGTFYITVRDATTGSRIEGASVNIYVIMGVLVGSGITDSQGIAQVQGFYEQDLTVKVVASGYEDKTEHLTFFSGNYQATILLFKNDSGTNYVTIGIYCITADNYRVANVKISNEVTESITNQDGFTNIICEPGQTDLIFSSNSAAMIKKGSLWEPLEFNTYTSRVTASSNAIFTSYVISGQTLLGLPPAQNSDGFMDWIVANWKLAVLVVALVVVMSRR